MAKVIKSSMLRNHLFDALKEISHNEKFLFITNKGEIVSALVNIDFFEDLLMKFSKKYKESIKEARSDYKQGNIFSEEDVFGDIA